MKILGENLRKSHPLEKLVVTRSFDLIAYIQYFIVLELLCVLEYLLLDWDPNCLHVEI